MATLERGFKAWAERTAANIRRDLGLSMTQPLDPRVLAKDLGIRVISPEDIRGLAGDILTQLLEKDPSGWSAATLLFETKTIVIYNPRNSKGRQASDIIHELAHVILGHEPSQIVFSEDGQIATRTFDRKQEDEANWLGWALLLPREALMAARHARLATPQIAERYGVSEKLVGFRLQMTGVEMQMRRRRHAPGA